MLLWRATIRHNSLKSTAVRPRDVNDNSYSHNESLNWFGRFGNRPSESARAMLITALHSGGGDQMSLRAEIVRLCLPWFMRAAVSP
jgi:hypothetical protein